MYQQFEQNERRTRQTALWLTVTAHVLFFTWLYLSASESPRSTASSKPVSQIEKPLVKTVGNVTP